MQILPNPPINSAKSQRTVLIYISQNTEFVSRSPFKFKTAFIWLEHAEFVFSGLDYLTWDDCFKSMHLPETFIILNSRMASHWVKVPHVHYLLIRG